MDRKFSSQKTIELVQGFSWLSFSLMLIASIVLTTLLVRSTITSSIESQKEYLILLAENFNRQLFRRFTLPIALAEDPISLREPDQYRLLDETVENMISGLEVGEVRILDKDALVVYSMNETELKEQGIELEEALAIFNQDVPLIFNEENKMPYYEAFIRNNVKPNTFLLEILFPLSVDKDLVSFFQDTSVLGVLQLKIDITAHYENAVHLQRWIITIFSISTLVLFLILQFTARKAAEIIAERIEKNKQLEAQLHQQEKLAGMGRVVASIAHEIRNPLGIIQSSAELLASRNKDILDVPSKKILAATIDETKRLAVVVNDFLDYARPRMPKDQKVDLSFCVKKALAFLEPKINSENIKTLVEIPDEIIITGEEDLIYRAIYNLLSNAIQALETEEERGAKLLGVKIVKNLNKELVLSVYDNGLGFSDEVLQRALDPFFTTKETGTGLGLSIVRSIVEAHSGKINLYNREEGGACVELTFEI